MAPPFKFTRYTEKELVACGRKFYESCKANWKERETVVWTEHVLDWFSETARKEIGVDARSPRRTGRRKTSGVHVPVRETIGEWLVDLVHSSYPKFDGNEYREYWKNAMDMRTKGDWSILLALESEWGKGRAPSLTREMVLYDASKLAALRANVKVLVTGVRTKHASQLEKDVEALRKRTGDDAPWLWVNLPNEAPTTNCRYVVFGKTKIPGKCS